MGFACGIGLNSVPFHLTCFPSFACWFNYAVRIQLLLPLAGTDQAAIQQWEACTCIILRTQDVQMPRQASS